MAVQFPIVYQLMHASQEFSLAQIPLQTSVHTSCWLWCYWFSSVFIDVMCMHFIFSGWPWYEGKFCYSYIRIGRLIPGSSDYEWNSWSLYLFSSPHTEHRCVPRHSNQGYKVIWESSYLNNLSSWGGQNYKIENFRGSILKNSQNLKHNRLKKKVLVGPLLTEDTEVTSYLFIGSLASAAMLCRN